MQTIEALLTASKDQQAKWVRAQFEDFEAMAYASDEWGDTCIGLIYPKEYIDTSDYEEFPGDYDTIGILQERLGELPSNRQEEILDGAPLKPEEVQELKKHIAEQDPDGWVGVHGWDAEAADGSVFVLGLGYSEGQGGIRLDEPRILRSRDDAEAWLKSHEIWSDWI